MTETGFDWRQLTAPAPPAPPSPESPGGRSMPAPVLRWLAIGGVVVVIAVTGLVLALTAPRPEVLLGGLDSAGPTGPGEASGAIDGVAGQVAASDGPITVDVDGAVVRPGLVTLPAGSRVGDAVAAAGGFGPAADARSAAAMNLAAPLTDGMQISVPDRRTATAEGDAADEPGREPVPPGGVGSGSGGDSRIDLDHATLAELDTLPGIGPVTANKILASRDEAPFAAVEDLLTRKLVGAATYEKVKDLVTADGR